MNEHSFTVRLTEESFNDHPSFFKRVRDIADRVKIGAETAQAMSVDPHAKIFLLVCTSAEMREKAKILLEHENK
jgi:hypothetical protein